MIKVKINRDKWLRGTQDYRGGALLTQDGRQCCIGFLATCLGARPARLRGQSFLSEVNNNKCFEFYQECSSPLEKAYAINDSGLYTDPVRERKLKALGKKMGVAFSFVTPRKKKVKK